MAIASESEIHLERGDTRDETVGERWQGVFNSLASAASVALKIEIFLILPSLRDGVILVRLGSWCGSTKGGEKRE